MYIHEKKLRRLLDAIENYKKCFSRFLKGYPNPQSAEITLEKALEGVLTAFQDPEVVAAFETARSQLPETINEQFLHSILQEFKSGTSISRFELSIADNFGFSKNAAKRIICELEIAEVEELSFNAIFERFQSLHVTMVKEVKVARKLPRKQKKSRKRNITLGMYSGVLGIGAGAANLVVLPTFKVSYGIAIGLIIQSGRDFIGEPVDDD